MTNEQYVRGDWMQTFTGKKFYPMDPSPEDIDPRDIAHSLSLLCRFGGHVQRFYSVAEHCVLMSNHVSPENALWALLHDATEAYVGDMVRPLKRSMALYQEAEYKVMAAVAERFGLESPNMPYEVKEADNRILLAERNALMSPTENAWEYESLEPLQARITGWGPIIAEQEYLYRIFELTKED